jgi:membrane associated rhomboid family serine protease
VEQTVEGLPERKRALTALLLPALAVLVLWCIWLLDAGLELDLARFGLYPREAKGLPGIITMPLLHGDWRHIFDNSAAVLLLGWCLLYFYPRVAGRVVLLTWIAGGIGVWLIGRAGSPHIGVSGVIYGLAAFLFTSGLLRGQRTLMALSLIVVFLYGSLVWGILPLVQGMSWEGHLCGAFVGLVLAFTHRHVPPAVSDPRPSFADEPDEDEPAAPYLEDDAGDAVNERELEWKRKLAERAERPGNVSTTWDQD